MKYFADLEKLSMELQKKSSNLEEYLYGDDVCRLVRWNEIVFLLELCLDVLSTSPSNADNSGISSKLIPDTQRIKEIETLIGSLLVDGLFLSKPDSFGSIYALRPRTQGVEPSSSSFRLETFQELSLLLGRDSTEMEYLKSSTESWENGEMFDSDISPQRSREFLALSSCSYLMYMALGELTDLKHTIEKFRLQKLPEWTSLDSSDIPPTADDGTRRVPPPPPMSEHTPSI